MIVILNSVSQIVEILTSVLTLSRRSVELFAVGRVQIDSDLPEILGRLRLGVCRVLCVILLGVARVFKDRWALTSSVYLLQIVVDLEIVSGIVEPGVVFGGELRVCILISKIRIGVVDSVVIQIVQILIGVGIVVILVGTSCKFLLLQI